MADDVDPYAVYSQPGANPHADAATATAPATTTVAQPAATPAPASAPETTQAYAVPGPNGTWVNSVTGEPAGPDLPTISVTPVIDVGGKQNVQPGATPGEAGSGYRPVLVGPKGTAGKALPSQPVAAPPPAPPLPPAPPANTGGAITAPAPAQPGAKAAGDPDDPYANLPTTEPTPSPDPNANATPAAPIPASVANQAMSNQAPYQALRDWVGGLTGASEHGFSLGIDEAINPIMPALIEHFQTGKPFSEAYDDIKARMVQPRQNFEERHGNVATAVEVASGVPTTEMMSPLFAPIRALPPGAAQKAVDVARNFVAGAGTSAATAATSTSGDLGDRASAAAHAALVGGPLAAAVPPLAAALTRAATPTAKIPSIVGHSVQEDIGNTVPQPSPLPNVKLNLPQATNSPAAATTLDTINTQNPAGRQLERSNQNQQMRDVLHSRVPGEPPLITEKGSAKQIAAKGSTRLTRGVQTAADIIDTEEKRLWNTDALKNRPISTFKSKELVGAEAKAIRRDDPGIVAGLEDPQITKLLGQLTRFPDKAVANQINSIRSQLLRIARDGSTPSATRVVAYRLANAASEGIWQAPEVIGRAPVTASSVGAGPSIPMPKAPSGATAAQKAAADRMMAAAAKLAVKAPKRPESAMDFLIRNKGIRPDADLMGQDLQKYHHQGGGRLLNRNGMSLNDARIKLAEEGYMPWDSTDDDVRNILYDHVSGRPTYRASDMLEADYYRQIDEGAAADAARHASAKDDVQHAADQMGVNLNPLELDHATRMRAADADMHPEEAVRQAKTARDEELIQSYAARHAFGPPGVAPGATTWPLPDIQELQNGIKADPELVRDLNAARAFTKREQEVLGHASFENILRRNSKGNETVVPGTAASRFYDFTNGVERPGTIKNVRDFLGDIKSEWLKMNAAQRGNVYDPAMIDPVMQDLQNGTQNFLFGKMLGAMQPTKELDLQGGRYLGYRQAIDFIDNNRDMLEQTGMVSHDQLGLLDRFRNTAEMLQRGTDLARVEGSQTAARAFQAKRFVDLFTGPFIGHTLGFGVSAGLGAIATHWLGEVAIGGMITAEMGGHAFGLSPGQAVVNALYRVPQKRLAAALEEAYRDPDIAHDLNQDLSNPKVVAGAKTRAWAAALVRSGTGQIVGTNTNRPPAPAEPETAQ